METEKQAQTTGKPGAEKPARATPPRRRLVKDWAAEKEHRRSVVAGAAKLAGWNPAEPITEKEYDAGFNRFTHKPLGGERKAPAGAGQIREG